MYSVSDNDGKFCLIDIVVSSNIDQGEDVQYYVIKFVSDLRQVGGFLRVLRFPPPLKTDRHDITERLLKVAVYTTKQTNKMIV
jgi:hypothetical protein